MKYKYNYYLIIKNHKYNIMVLYHIFQENTLRKYLFSDYNRILYMIKDLYIINNFIIIYYKH